jgi:DNA-binding NarL/FixJ family response regulator
MTQVFIDRRDHARVLETFVEAVPTGPRALWLRGDAGIGKTTLLDQGIRMAGVLGFRVLVSRAARAEAPLAFATLGDLVTPVLNESLPSIPPVQRRALETALLLREPEGPPPDTRMLGLALLSVLTTLAVSAPVLVALDDAQWIDGSSAAVLSFTLRRLRDGPVGVLGTIRESATDRTAALEHVMQSTDRVEIGPLSLHDTTRLLWARFALHLPRPSLVKVHQTSGGNPFLALELGRSVAEGSLTLDGGPLTLPPRVSDLVDQRLARLPLSVGHTLVAVAAMGSPVVTVLAPLSATVVDDLEVAAERDLVLLDGDRIRFTHPLLAAACYQSMPLHRRRELHRRLAALDVDPEERARHLAMGATEADQEIAAALDAAASHATARGARQSASELAQLAVGMTPSGSTDELNRRRICAAEHCRQTGDPAEARSLLQLVVDSAPPGPARARALGQLAHLRAASAGFREAESLFLLALDEPGLPLADQARLTGELAWRVNAGGHTSRGLEYAESALAIAEQADEPAVLATSLATVAELTFWRTSELRQDLLDRAVTIEAGLGYDVDARGTLARLVALCDRHGQARAMFEDLIADARAGGDDDVTGHLFFLSRMELAAGNWDTAEAMCDEGAEVAGEHGDESSEGLFRATRCELDAYRGRAERARLTIPVLQRAVEEGGFVGAVHRLGRAMGTLELSCDDPAAAWQEVGPLLDGLAELSWGQSQVAGAVGIEALIGLGRHTEAERLLVLLEKRAHGSDSGLRLLADRCRGVLQDAVGESDLAIEALSAAANATYERNALEAARTVLALGTAQRRAQHKRDARRTLERAYADFELLGASGWVERARSELGRIGGRVASEQELSETERLIVDAVVAGRRNKEVAADLHLSPHTVAWNLSKVYRKLGVASRTELAARMAESPPD